MNDEMRTEAMELCVTACEKFASNNEVRLLWDSGTNLIPPLPSLARNTL